MEGIEMIVGRRKEKRYLEQALNANRAQFITVYGRRRVGKTYLIQQFFATKKCIFFHVTGTQSASMKTQLQNFTNSLSETFFDDEELKTPTNWSEAFKKLRKQVAKTEGKVVIFLDELPWLATHKSGFLEVLEHDWNRYFSSMSNVILIVCGSSASWILKKVIYNKGGLHNRTTRELSIKPFSLSETKAFLKSRTISLTDNQVLSLYMALGGIPYYLEYVEAGLTAAENIQQLFFNPEAPLAHEFHKLFESLFKEASSYIELVRAIAKKREGVSRIELTKSLPGTQVGGGLSKKLRDLEETGFIHAYIPLQRKRGEYYRLTDEYCLFYLYWLDHEKQTAYSKTYWSTKITSPKYHAWSGYSFESICLRHSEQIIQALNIHAAVEISSWRYTPKKPSEKGAQIDLVLNRNDDAITLCEIKYTTKPFVMDKKNAQAIQRKIEVFKHQTKTEKQLFIAFIASNGVKKSVYLDSTIQAIVTLKDLFRTI